jgi:hypothetical protein
MNAIHAMVLVLSASLGVAAAAGAASPAPPRAPAAATVFDATAAARFASLALDCVAREYPNKIAHVLSGEQDVRPPHALTPAFYGCYDWHSAVHGHWLLARLARTFPTAPFAAPARAALAKSLTTVNVGGEVAYLLGKGRTTFERPYGLAWVLQLAAELRDWDDPDARVWAGALSPLEQWLPKLTRPIRIGEHDQTAFAFALVLDWAETAEKARTRDVVAARARDYYLADRDCPLSYEPSGQDFLSPCLAEADLMRRLLPPARFAPWLSAFLPAIPRAATGTWITPAVVTDPTDPKLAHLDGLNLSRAWMLDGIAFGLPPRDPRVLALSAAARAHREAGLRAVTGEHYEGGHWLGTFAVYLSTARGLRLPPVTTTTLDRPSRRP